jgi:hypothetical protein
MLETNTFLLVAINILVFVILLMWWGKKSSTTIVTPTPDPVITIPKLTTSTAETPKLATEKPKLAEEKPKLIIGAKGEIYLPPQSKETKVIYRPDFEYIQAVDGPTKEEGKLGTNLKGIDVTKLIKFDKDGNVLNPFVCCSEKLTDPAKGVPKVLIIRYKRTGRSYKAILQEGSPIEGCLP